MGGQPAVKIKKHRDFDVVRAFNHSLPLVPIKVDCFFFFTGHCSLSVTFLNILLFHYVPFRLRVGFRKWCVPGDEGRGD